MRFVTQFRSFRGRCVSERLNDDLFVSTESYDVMRLKCQAEIKKVFCCDGYEECGWRKLRSNQTTSILDSSMTSRQALRRLQYTSNMFRETCQPEHYHVVAAQC